MSNNNTWMTEKETKETKKIKNNAIKNRTNDNNTRIAKQESFVKGLSFNGILKFILVVLLLSTLVRTITNNTPLTFSSFFEQVVNSKATIDLEFVRSITNLQIIGDWGVFEFLRVFLNTNIEFLSGGFLVLTLILNGILYVFSFISWIFLV